jgi:DNA-directed RNA polymerase specialized sigma24 family protein
MDCPTPTDAQRLQWWLSARALETNPIDAVARLAHARRELLLRAHRQRLPPEDLEDAYSQATLELVARARHGPPFKSLSHLEHSLNQKLESRIADRRRALAGRSPMQAALARSLPLGGSPLFELGDCSPSVEERVETEFELSRLREVALDLTVDMRLVLVGQVVLGLSCAEFCESQGWTHERFRKVAQRAREKLRRLVADYSSGERCRGMEGAISALAAGIADRDQARRARVHLGNCPACRARQRRLDDAGRRLLSALPWPLLVGAVRAGSAALGPASAVAVGTGAGSGAGSGAGLGLGSAGSGAGSGAGLGLGGAAGGAGSAAGLGLGGAGGGAGLGLGGAGLGLGGAGGLKAGLAVLCIAGLAGGGAALGRPAAPVASATPRPAAVARVARPARVVSRPGPRAPRVAAGRASGVAVAVAVGDRVRRPVAARRRRSRRVAFAAAPVGRAHVVAEFRVAAVAASASGGEPRAAVDRAAAEFGP